MTHVDVRYAKIDAEATAFQRRWRAERVHGRAKIRTHWQDHELVAIVPDYFEMLEADLSGRPYVKLRHSQALMARVGRTHRSIECPCAGACRGGWTDPGPSSPARSEVRSGGTRYRNRSLGRAGESFVVDLERRQLAEAERADLARNVRWVAAEDGDGAGYDILSVDRSDCTRLMEVKTTNGSAANLNQRLGSASVRSRVEASLAAHAPDLFLSQEPFQLTMPDRRNLVGFRLLATNPLTSCWIAEEHVNPTVVQLSDRWQKISLDWLTLHNVYLSPYSAKERCGQLYAIAADLARPTTDVIVGDFNLAPRAEDGVFGSRSSTFTTAGERKALTALLKAGTLFDSTCPVDGGELAFTFERTVKRKASKFRCDLALISERLRSSVTVVYDHSVRERGCGFTDHSAVVLNIADLPMRLAADAQSVTAMVSRSGKSQQATVWTSAAIATAAHKTAIRRREPSQIARNLLAWDVLKELGVKSILDFGCAYGADVTFYRENGFKSDGYDIEPRFGRTQMSDVLFDLVTVVYVVNVLPTLEDRLAAIRVAAERVKPGGYMLLVARSDASIARKAQRQHWDPLMMGGSLVQTGVHFRRVSGTPSSLGCSELLPCRSVLADYGAARRRRGRSGESLREATTTRSRNEPLPFGQSQACGPRRGTF